MISTKNSFSGLQTQMNSHDNNYSWSVYVLIWASAVYELFFNKKIESGGLVYTKQVWYI